MSERRIHPPSVAERRIHPRLSAALIKVPRSPVLFQNIDRSKAPNSTRPPSYPSTHLSATYAHPPSRPPTSIPPNTFFPLKDLITIIGESLGKLLSVLRDISSSSRRVEADRGSNEACKLQSAPLARTSSSDAGTPNGEAPATQVAEQHRRVPPLGGGGQGR